MCVCQRTERGAVDDPESQNDPVRLIRSKETDMIETIAIILLILWGLGLLSSYTLGGFIHILLVAAILLIVVRLLQGRRI